jgi:predicted lactoylglutathione lyase
MIFVNLPVKDLKRATAFYEGLGYSINPQFSDDNGTCIEISYTIFVMLLVEAYFSTFARRPIADAKATTAMILALSADSREEVDGLLAKALAGGGEEAADVMDQGFMYSRTFQDPDGHVWEAVYMDAGAVAE